MGLHRRLFRSSLLIKLRYNIIISNNQFKQTFRFHHHNTTLQKPNPNPKFLLTRHFGNKKPNDKHKGDDHYFSLLSTDGRRISHEKNFYFRPPRGAQPQCPFAVIGDNINHKYNNNVFAHEIFEPPYPVRVVGTCDGLVCLHDDNYIGNYNVLVWNTLTNDCRVIDCSPIKHHYRYSRSPGFHCAGFGFDPNSKDYKVVMEVDKTYLNTKYEAEFEYEVCSLKTGTWWPLRFPKVHPSSSFRGCDSIHIDGIQYRSGFTDETANIPGFILSFNFANEEFNIFPMPEKSRSIRFGQFAHSDYAFRLVEYEGLLGFVLYPVKGDEKNFELWVREKDESWSKVASLCVIGVERPLAYWSKQGKWFFEGTGHGLLVLDLDTEEMEPLDIYDFPGAMEIFPFAESLISPNGTVV